MVSRNPKSTLNFLKIIKTKNLSDGLCEKIISELISEQSFIVRDDTRSGFYEEFIFSEEKNCDLDFLIINNQYENAMNNVEYDETNENHIKIFKLNYIYEYQQNTYDIFVDFFFIPYYNLIIANGPKGKSEKPIKLLINKLNVLKEDVKNALDFDIIDFYPDFLLWLTYKKSIDSNISEKIKIENFSDFYTDYFPDNNELFDPGSIPQQISTKNTNSSITLPIIYGLLNNRDFSYLKGKFIYEENKFEVSINVIPEVTPESEIFVKSNYCIRGENYCNKLRLVLPFINDLVDTFISWKSSDIKDKYPSEDFIKKLKVNLISEFNFTLYEYYKYEGDFNRNLNKSVNLSENLISINPNLDEKNFDDETMQYIDKLVDKNVLLYLSD